jgi:hypothetical protein
VVERESGFPWDCYVCGLLWQHSPKSAIAHGQDVRNGRTVLAETQPAFAPGRTTCQAGLRRKGCGSAVAGASGTESLEVCVVSVHAFGNVCAGCVLAGSVARVRVQFPGEVQRHVYAHGVVERGFGFQRERFRARVDCATFTGMEISDHILERACGAVAG